jgi:hypothetical protein
MRFITMMGTAALSMTAATLAQTTTFNEIRTGAGNAEYIELKGTPGASLAGLTIVVLGDGTSITKSGAVEWLYRFAKTDVIGSNGYLVLHNPGANPAYVPTPPATGGDPEGTAFPFTIDPAATNLPWGYQTPTGSVGLTQLESPDNMTFMLVSGYTGTDTFQTRAPSNGQDGQDLDTNDDGALDITPWSAILDSVAFKETNGSTPTGNQDWWYSTNTCGPYISRNIQTTGAPIAKWSFPTPITVPTSGVYTYGAADSGANATGSSLKGVHAAAATAWSTPAGQTGSPDLAFSSNNWATNDYYEASASTLNFSGVTLEWAQYRSGTGPADFRVDMSTDGGASFTTVLNTYTLTAASSWASKSIASIPNAGNKDSVIFRFIDIAATGASGGANRIDNVLIRSDANAETIVTSYAGPTMGIKQANGTWFIGVASTTVGQQDTPGSLNYAAPTYTCGDPLAGDCAVAHGNAFCADACCCAYVGGLDPYCVTVRWDAICVTAAAGCAANCTALPCPADLNGDTIVNGADLGIMLGDWGGSERDLNGDAIVNGADLGLLLGAWGNCP